MLYILIIFVLLFAYLAWRKPIWALSFVVLALPTYLLRFEIRNIPTTLLEIMILVLFVVWLIKTILEKQKITFSKYKWWILLLLVVATVSAFVTSVGAQNFEPLPWGIWKAYFIEPILFFLVFINTVKTKKEWNLVVGALWLSAFLVAIPAIIQKFTGWGIPNEFWRNEATRRITSWYGFPNAVGLYLAPIGMFFAGLLMQNKINVIEKFKQNGLVGIGRDLSPFRKNFWKTISILFLFVLIVLSLIFAGSEGALIGLVAGLIFLGLVYPYRLTRIATLICLLSCFLAFLIVPNWREYASEKFTMSDRSGQIRQQQWKETWTMLKEDHQILGGGLANYQTAIKPYHAEGIWIKDKNDHDWINKIRISEEFRIKNWQPTEIYLYPHNILLNFWSEIGILGAGIMLVLVLKLFLGYLRVKSQENKRMYLILMSVFVVILVHGLVDVPYFKNDLSVFWWMLFGLSVVLIKRKEILIK
ncbi:MAG: O-antigen polymerase [Parcubacteria group bacterium GW2011_GWC2_39_14]|nr:MAG: O-antigen polymerase [Parcubacteria group bacterium GW2011_GWC2_39_14]KKR55248.1 MAG: O-antigen polymerase [Parcubacteria group bacterium GW2011_GWA2_40_23]